MTSEDTIVALATPKGRAGIAVIRLSGGQVPAIAKAILGVLPKPRYAHYGSFYGAKDQVLDKGLGLYFPGPHSYTGEDVLELQGHSSPVLVAALIARVIELGGRQARAGEFSKRAFLNGRMDLTEAEAVSSLIEAHSFQAAQSALLSLQGVFKEKVLDLMAQVLALRVQVEGGIDFVEQDLDLKQGDWVARTLNDLVQAVIDLQHQATCGVALTQNHRMVLFGPPNVGKSTLMNYLTQQDTSIVSNHSGTTRDLVTATVQLSGLEFDVVDTAGMRTAANSVESLGVERAHEMVRCANFWVGVIDSAQAPGFNVTSFWQDFGFGALPRDQFVLVINKADRVPGLAVGVQDQEGVSVVTCSLHTGAGVADLLAVLQQKVGGVGSAQTPIGARLRHVQALSSARVHLQEGAALWHQGSYELVAHILGQAHDVLGTIIGHGGVESLLGEIFSTFCVGK
jgi:tRNA modification GTPase